MTIGIYALYWEEQDLIYIGLSENIERRYRDHLRLGCAKKHPNYKVQNAFHRYEIPKLIIIEKCLVSELNNKEIYWTKEFDSLNKGLNIVEAGKVGYGINSNGSKYSKLQILQVFRGLIKLPSITTKDLNNQYNVSVQMIRNILNGSSHKWLEEKYPFHYALMQDRAIIRKNLNTENKVRHDPALLKFMERPVEERTVICPEGYKYIIANISLFAREHKLHQSNLSALLNDKIKQTKKWKRAH